MLKYAALIFSDSGENSVLPPPNAMGDYRTNANTGITEVTTVTQGKFYTLLFKIIIKFVFWPRRLQLSTLENSLRIWFKIIHIFLGEEGVVTSNNSIQPEWRSNYKGDYKDNVNPISTKDLIAWSFQIARGMEYLASRKVICL